MPSQYDHCINWQGTQGMDIPNLDGQPLKKNVSYVRHPIKSWKNYPCKLGTKCNFGTACRALKLQWKLKPIPYEVVHQLSQNILVFGVRTVDDCGPFRTVHRNMLRSCTFLERNQEPTRETTVKLEVTVPDVEWWMSSSPVPGFLNKEERWLPGVVRARKPHQIPTKWPQSGIPS